ncbi:UDP-N-acetylmuramoyl-L-alanyl-D-glutamate--2,6-diaminopimelate ligase [Moraxella nasovis]|uniref:UDP-N-acetylmuramoyl-L-alanyl-D-glutamate--2, 6-diaminopimelate ligase n=1 Tax=Moraxella nasovis TaxID=2904121 RepID=UPI001F6217F3|nr:UDP-N-acetylmuramoyl-L-alanyl-D-glutamate--2,6-diaminopimelate ligase [Moraxella nasovis]UNU72669.1 UDP-N-acetylmuramoyl-L-alanyl-D-glutamate--2,6-diaminopimelate ligase [Moraxella nasovis]
MKIAEFKLSSDIQNKLDQVANLEFNGFAVDSRKLIQGNAFILLKSQNPNATVDLSVLSAYLTQVQDKAAFVLSEVDVLPIADDFDLPIVIVPNIREYLGELIAQSLQHNHAAKLPTVVAVTGTNGKTTISQLTAQLISGAGVMTAVMGTAGNGILPDLSQSTHTTLESFHLHHAMHDFATKGVQVLCVEASSHGLHQHRLQGVPISVAVFSNLSRDHLDYHADMDDYAAAKAKLFDKDLFSRLTHAVIHLDDEFSGLMIDKAKHSKLTVWTYSTTNAQATFFAKNITPSLDGVRFTLVCPFGEIALNSPLLGLFNVANLLASVATLLAISPSAFNDLPKLVAHLQGARGRMERVCPDKTPCVIVDYAHTPDALTQVLTNLKAHCLGKLWAVFGCGGDRDRGKRPLMAKAGLALADKVVLTSDNPRTEKPTAILADMQVGMTCEEHYKTVIEADRAKAIEYAVKNANADDIVVIAGKGHETYQEINGVRHDFDDTVVVKSLLNEDGLD